MSSRESPTRHGSGWQHGASVTLLFSLAYLAGCPGSSAAPDSGSTDSTDAGRDAGVTIPCRLIDGTNCTRDAGGFGVCCDGTCVDTGSDPSNCDQCGSACPSGATCRASTCELGGSQATCFDGGCPTGLACAGGYYCGTLSCPAGEVGGWCALSATGDEAGICCSGTCLDVSSDDLNCGACGRACVDGGSCVNRSCEASSPDAGMDAGDAGMDAGDAGLDAGPDGGDAGIDAGPN